MKNAAFLSVVALFVASAALADFDRAGWEYRKEIQGNAGSGFVLLDLDEDVLNHSNDTLSDLRIVDDRGGEVPYTIAAEGDRSLLSGVPTRLFNKSFVRGESTIFTLDIGSAGQFHNRVVIHTNSENYRRMVEIEGSNDGAGWRYLTTRGQIYNYTVRDDIKPVSISDATIDYPESTVRYLRVRILDRGEPPLSISGASVSRNIQIVAKEASFHPTLTVSHNTEKRTTDIVADLGIRGIPTRRARLAIEDTNFNRQVDILASNNTDDWRLVSSYYIFRVNTEKFRGENVTLSYPETQTRYLKFVIYNRDDQALRVSNLELFGVLRKLVFNYASGGSYMLYYGNRDARRPEYDIERLFPYLDTAGMDYVALSREDKNPDFKPPALPLKPLTERNPYVLPVALGIIVAILAFLLLRLFVKTKPEGAI